MITLDNISINSAFKSVKIYERKESKILVGIEVKQKEKPFGMSEQLFCSHLQKYNSCFFFGKGDQSKIGLEFIIQGK